MKKKKKKKKKKKQAIFPTCSCFMSDTVNINFPQFSQRGAGTTK